MQRNPRVRVLLEGSRLPRCHERKAERAAEANSDGPLAVQRRDSSGNAGPPDLLTSDYPSCSFPAPKDRKHGTDTLCFPPNTLQGVHTRVWVCKDAPVQHWLGTSTLVHIPPRATKPTKGSSLDLGVTSLPTPSFMSPSSGLSQDKAHVGLSSLLVR